MKNLLLSLLVISLSISANASIIYVNTSATGGNNGTTWANAYVNLQDAIDAANSGDEIWIAQGTYFPTKDKSGNASPSDNRQKTFYIDIDAIQLYGGFIGNETMLTARDWENNPTILSGDIGVLSVNTDNAYHVMHIDGTTGTTISSATRVDGLIIEEGSSVNTAAYYPSRYGGGIYNDARNAGSESSPTIANCTFRNNIALMGGGAICTDFNHTGSSNYTILNCTFENNSGTIGGAIMDFENSNLPPGNVNGTIQNCIFHNNNISSGFGGAYGNNGGIFDLDIDNCLFITNGNSGAEGGAIYFASEGQMDIRQSTFYGNMAQFGGAVSSRTITGSNAVKVENSIMWNNGSNQFYRTTATNASLEFVHTLYEGYYNWTATTNHIFDLDPVFVDVNNPKGVDNIWRTADDGFNLEYCSPAIDEGFTSLPLITTDIQGATRMKDNDLGAYESIAAPGTPPVCNASSPLPPLGAGTLYRSKYKSAPDANGWTHFCDCNGNLVGSLNLVGTGAVVPANGVGLKTFDGPAEYHSNGVGFVNNPNGGAFLTKKLEVYPDVQPSIPVGVRFYFLNFEFIILNSTLNTYNQSPIPSISDLEFYKVSNPNTNVYPEVPTLMPSDVVIISNHPTISSTSTWVLGAKGSDHYAEYKVASFSPTGGGGGGPGGTPLPVEWLSFDVEQKANDAVLSWSTATEINNSGFHIEHSLDGRSFDAIGWQEGAGNSSQTNNYNFIHHNVNGTNYYRIVQEDFDGTVDYSEIKVLNLEREFNVELFPNPSYDGIVNLGYYTEKEQDLNIQVFDVSGKLVISRNILLHENMNLIELNFSILQQGIYILNINDDAKPITKKLVIH